MTSAIFEAILGLLLLVLFVAKFLNVGVLSPVNSIWKSIGAKVAFVNKWWFSLIFLGLSLGLVSAPFTQSKASKLGVDREEYLKLESDSQLYGLTPEKYFEEIKKSKSLGFDSPKSMFEANQMGFESSSDYFEAKKLSAKDKTEYLAAKQDMKNRGVADVDLYIKQINAENLAREQLAAENEKKRLQIAREREARLPAQVADSLGMAFWAECAASQVSIMALDARGDNVPKDLLDANNELGNILGKTRMYFLARNYPSATLDGMLRSFASRVQSGDDAARTVVECIKRIDNF